MLNLYLILHHVSDLVSDQIRSGLQIDEAKTKLMVATLADLPTTNPNLRRCDVQIGERTFKVVPEFTYLGSKVSWVARKDAGCQPVILQPEKSVHPKELVATDETGTI